MYLTACSMYLSCKSLHDELVVFCLFFLYDRFILPHFQALVNEISCYLIILLLMNIFKNKQRRRDKEKEWSSHNLISFTPSSILMRQICVSGSICTLATQAKHILIYFPDTDIYNNRTIITK